jgi:hypothetical protein
MAAPPQGIAQTSQACVACPIAAHSTADWPVEADQERFVWLSKRSSSLNSSNRQNSFRILNAVFKQ